VGSRKGPLVDEGRDVKCKWMSRYLGSVRDI